MAVDKVRGTQLYIKIGNGATPNETFAHPCLVNAKRGIKFQSNTNKVIIPDCDNPEDPAWQETFKDGLNVSIDGAGKLDAAAIPSYDTWFREDVGKNVQIWLGTKGYWAGSFKLTGWQIDGDRNDYCDVTITLESHGSVAAWNAA